MSKWHKVEMTCDHYINNWSGISHWLSDKNNVQHRWKRRAIWIDGVDYFCYKFKSEFDATAFKLTWL